MKIEDAREHTEHLCDVWPTDERDEHIGVIAELDEENGSVLVSGVPAYGERWFPIADVTTNCKVVSFYHRARPEPTDA
jgi:hypothetical protein